MTVKPLPAVCGLPLETTVKVEAAAGVTLIAPLVPVIVAVTVSTAVSDWLPTVLSVAESAWTPLSPDTKV